MPGLPFEFQALHHDALVHAHRLKARRLANHRVTGLGSAGLGQRPGTVHGAFLVGGGQDDQWLLQRLIHKRFRRFDGQRKEAFHVTGAQAVPAVVLLGQGEGVALPALVVKRHGVGVAGQHQATRTTAQGGDQIVFAGHAGHFQDFHGEPHRLQPFSQGTNHRLIAVIPIGGRAGDRGQGNQPGQHLLDARYLTGCICALHHGCLLALGVSLAGPCARPQMC